MCPGREDITTGTEIYRLPELAQSPHMNGENAQGKAALTSF